MENSSKMNYIFGIDLSWKSTGVVQGKDSLNPDTESFKLNQYNLISTYNTLKSALAPPTAYNSFYIIEDYSRGGAYQNPNSLIAMAELRGILGLALEEMGASINIKIIYVAPTQLKKFITGSGKGDKAQIIKEVYKRWGFDAKNSDEADSFGLWKIGVHLCNMDSWSSLIKPQQEVLNALWKKYKLILENINGN